MISRIGDERGSKLQAGQEWTEDRSVPVGDSRGCSAQSAEQGSECSGVRPQQTLIFKGAFHPDKGKSPI